MTQTINVTQEILDGLSSGEHTLEVTATTESGFTASNTATFVTVGNPEIDVDASQGGHASAFSFDITLEGVNGNATVYGYIDNVEFYQLNYGVDGTYSVNVGDSVLNALGGGSHEISFSLTDSKGKSASATSSFTKIYSLPVVSVASNVGDKTGSFALPFTILNAKSEHPSLSVYMDATTDEIFQTDDAANVSSVTIDTTELAQGTHSIIIEVTNDAGTTTKTTAFNLTAGDKTYTGLKLGYSDDTWDSTVLENRIYEETDVTYQGQTYKSFEDVTPYDTEGEVVTGGLLASLSREVQNAGASTLTRNSDGSYTEISAHGVSNLTRTSDGYVEVYTDKEGNVITKNVYINVDGSVSESTVFERAE